MSKVLVLLATGFEDVEMVFVVDLLNRADISFTLASLEQSKEVVSSSSITYTANKYIDDVNLNEYDLLFLPGGKGTSILLSSMITYDVLSHFHEKNKFIAAICAAPSILGQTTILDQKQFTCYPGFETKINNGMYSEDGLVVDGKVITAKGLAYASDLGLKIIELLNKDQLEHVYQTTLLKEKEETK